MSNFRYTDTEEEIISFFMAAKKVNSEVTLWQDIGGRKIVCKTTFDLLEDTEQSLLFNCRDQAHLALQLELPVFVKFDYRHILFKGKILNLHSQTLKVQLPKEFHTNELRNQRRRKLRLAEQNIIAFTFQHPLHHSPTKLKLSVIDLSQTGAALLGSYDEAIILQEGRLISIMQFGSKNLVIPHLAKVIHIIPLNYHPHVKGKVAYRLGIHFEGPIPERYFQFFEV